MSEKPFCEICGLFEIEHPVPKPGPPQPPPLDRPEGEVWRPPHEFTPSRFTLPELLDERDAQIHHWRRRTYKLHHRLNAVRIALGVPQRPAPEGGDTEREAVWLCAKCGRGSEEHAAGGPSEDCVADMRLRPVAPAPRGAEQERLVDLTHALATDFKDGERLTDRQREEIARQAWNIAVDLSEHGAEGDEEPSCQPPGAEQLRPPDRTEEALRKRIAEADEQINRLHVTLTEARRERDAERERRIEMTRMGERGELSGWKERAEQAEAELAEARRAAKDLQDDVEREMWAKADFLARAETAERERDELAGEVERLQAESQIFRNALRTLAQKYGDTDLIEGPLARADREASALAEGSRDG
jgi:hypothetical protein